MVKKFSLKSETICGYKVSAKMKKVWQVQLDVIKKIDQICRAHNIDYSLCGGSLLGAIRHKGYIPWDDDIDICMMRADYERFLAVAKNELKNPYFVQHWSTEPGYYRGHTQIRRSDTTAIIKLDEGYNFNRGIFVDIFVFDKIPDDAKKRESFIKHIKLKQRLIMKPDHNRIKELIHKIGLEKLIKNLDHYAQKYNKQDTEQCGAICFRPDEFKYDTKWFAPGNFMDAPFEDLTVRITKDYDALLSRQYGNYMKLPEQRGDGSGSIHGHTFFDTEKSYKKYDKQLKKICEKL